MPRTKASNQPLRTIQLQQPLLKLEPRRGGSFYLTIPAHVVDQFPKGKQTRLLCTIDERIVLNCGLNHLGNGDFFIIVATRHVKVLGVKPGDTLRFTLEEAPQPLGVDLPEVLEALLEQDEDLAQVFEGMTDGKKRSLVFLLQGSKDVDRQVQKAIQFLTDVKAGRSPYKRK